MSCSTIVKLSYLAISNITSHIAAETQGIEAIISFHIKTVSIMMQI
ncbi:hypothetical protein LJC21_02900 [Bacteroides sp. OttesenSCG-928-E20]|nr:hypothetical protein [Bacteroides sp. OttesenSCG-928-E20]